jgi:putative endonuclease
MASVYILYSQSLDKFYTGGCKEIDARIAIHLSKYFPDAYTAKVNDWIVYFQINSLHYIQARKIEIHIKKMKSRKYIQNLKKYPDLPEKLKILY